MMSDLGRQSFAHMQQSRPLSDDSQTNERVQCIARELIAAALSTGPAGTLPSSGRGPGAGCGSRRPIREGRSVRGFLQHDVKPRGREYTRGEDAGLTADVVTRAIPGDRFALSEPPDTRAIGVARSTAMTLRRCEQALTIMVARAVSTTMVAAQGPGFPGWPVSSLPQPAAATASGAPEPPIRQGRTWGKV